MPVTPPVLYQQLFPRQPNNGQQPNNSSTSSSSNSTPQPLGVWPQSGNNTNNNRPGGNPNMRGGPGFGNDPAGGFFNVLAQVDQAPLWNVMEGAANTAPPTNVDGVPGGGRSLRILPKQSAALLLNGVCLAFGSPTPTPRMAYRLTPLESLTPKPELRRLLTIVGSENIPQRVAQPAAWYLANGLSWEKLTDHSSLAGMRTQKLRFSPAEITAAQQLVQRVTSAKSNSGAAPASSGAAGRPTG